MKIYKYFIIFIFIISCSSNDGVYWCGDHACVNNKEKEAYFKKTMIVEIRNVNKSDLKSESVNEKIIKESQNNEKKLDTKSYDEEENITDEREIEQQVELQEKIDLQQKELKEQIKIEEEKRLDSKIRNQEESSSFVKVIEMNEISSMNFDELADRILARNSSRSYPKINDIPK